MFYQILIRTAESVNDIPYQYYRTLASAKKALMDWARGVLALHPDKKYSEIPADPRSTGKVLLRAAIAASGEKPAYEGIIVEHAFADEDESFSSRLADLTKEAEEAIVDAVGIGDTVLLPYSDYNEEGRNLTVTCYGNMGDFRVDVQKVHVNERRDVLVSGIGNDDGQEYVDVDLIVDPELVYIADAVLETKNKENV